MAIRAPRLRPYALTTPDRARELGTGLAGAPESKLVMAINAVSKAMATYCGRPLHHVEVTSEDPELFQGWGSSQLQLRCYPIVEVDQVLVDGQAVTDFSSASQFLAQGQLYREVGWPWSGPRHDDVTCDPNFGRTRYNVAVAYRGGYVTPLQAECPEHEDHEGEPLPDDIEIALFRELGDIFSGARNTGRIRREKTAGGYEVEFAMSAIVQLSRETQDVLRGYVMGGLP